MHSRSSQLVAEEGDRGSLMAKADRKRPLVREAEPAHKTGFEIPVPKTEDFDRVLRKAAIKKTKRPRR